MHENLQIVLDSKDGRGTNVILDCVGSPALMEKGLAILRKAGRHLLVSVMRGVGPEVKVNVAKIMARGQSLHGINTWSLSLTEAKDIMFKLSQLFEDGKFHGPDGYSISKVNIADASGAYQEVTKMDRGQCVVVPQEQ